MKRVSAHRGPRQPRRRPHAAGQISARERVRFALVRVDSSIKAAGECEFAKTRVAPTRGRADAKRPRCLPTIRPVRSETAAPRLSRPSMGRDTLSLPSNKHCRRQGGQGLGSQASRVVAGIRFPVMASLRAPGPPALRGGNLRRAPAESPAVQAGIQAHATRRAKSLPALAPARCAKRERQARSAWQKSAAGKAPSRDAQGTAHAAHVDLHRWSTSRKIALDAFNPGLEPLPDRDQSLVDCVDFRPVLRSHADSFVRCRWAAGR